MLGNIKFVGRLLVTKMLAPRILIACSEVLLTDYTPETLESLAVLLTATGATYDEPQWTYQHNPNKPWSSQRHALPELALFWSLGKGSHGVFPCYYSISLCQFSSQPVGKG